MRWWGWGEDGGAVTLPEAALAQLRAELGMDGSEGGGRVELEEVSLPESALADATRRALERAVGAENVADGREARVTHALGKSFADLVRIRSGDGSGARGAVVRHGSGDVV